MEISVCAAIIIQADKILAEKDSKGADSKEIDTKGINSKEITSKEIDSKEKDSKEIPKRINSASPKILICQRPAHKSQALLWEFPGGKKEDGETSEQCLVRECEEELGIQIEILSLFDTVRHTYPEKSIYLEFYISRIISGDIEQKEHAQLAWVFPHELEKYDFCPADTNIIQKLMQEKL